MLLAKDSSRFNLRKLISLLFYSYTHFAVNLKTKTPLMQTKLKIIIKRMPADESNVEFSGFIKMYFRWLIIHFSPNNTPQIKHAKVIAVSASDHPSILDMYRDLCDFCCQDEFEHTYVCSAVSLLVIWNAFILALMDICCRRQLDHVLRSCAYV
jgi:hypothetical protein